MSSLHCCIHNSARFGGPPLENAANSIPEYCRRLSLASPAQPPGACYCWILTVSLPGWVRGLLFGIVATICLLGATFGFLPSPLEFFRDIAAECRQTATHEQQETKESEGVPDKRPPDLQEAQSDKLKSASNNEKAINDCLIAKYTGSLADFTRWLVFVTAIVALFGFWQVVISRRTARSAVAGLCECRAQRN